MCTVLRPETLVVFHVEINDAVMQRTIPRSQLPAPPHHARGGSPSLYFSDASEKTLFVFFSLCHCLYLENWPKFLTLMSMEASD